MLYTLEQGKHEEAIIRQCIQQNKPFPKKIANAPELHFGLQLYMQAFWDLDTTRPVSGGVFHPIPWYEINRWSDEWELSQDQHEVLHYIIREMDNAYLKFQQNKIDTERRRSMGTKPPLLTRFKNG